MKDLFYRVEKESKNIFYKLYIHKIGTFKFNWHREIEINIVLKGKVEFCVEGERYILESDDFIIINSNSGHATLSTEPDTIVMVLHINPIYFKEYFDDYENIRFKNSVRFSKEEDQRCNSIKYLLAKLIKELQKEEGRNQIVEDTIFNIIMANIVEIFCPFIDKEGKGKKSSTQIKVISKVLKYIEDNHREKISLNKIASIMGYNSSYVSQFFKSNIGINYYEYLTRIRIREATFELVKTKKSISDIALDHGFSDIKAFNKNFKESFGRSPKQYRKEIDQCNDVDVFSIRRVFIKDNNKHVIKKLKEYQELIEDNIIFINNDMVDEKIKINQANDIMNYKNKIAELEEELKMLNQKLKTIKEILN